jgi:hypothetical protein
MGAKEKLAKAKYKAKLKRWREASAAQWSEEVRKHAALRQEIADLKHALNLAEQHRDFYRRELGLLEAKCLSPTATSQSA